MSLCKMSDSDFKDQECDCADCCHEEGVCVSIDSGSGCECCEGPVTKCDLSVCEYNEGVVFVDKMKGIPHHDGQE